MTATDIDINPQPPAPKRRISPRVRHAMHVRVSEGLSWLQCAEAAGLSEAGIHKARKQQHVIDYHQALKNNYIAEIEEMRGQHKAHALDVARELMDNAKSEAVKARMVEFFAGEAKGGGVNVAVQVNNAPAKGYSYVRPGQTVVEIGSPHDAPSCAIKDITPTE